MALLLAYVFKISGLEYFKHICRDQIKIIIIGMMLRKFVVEKDKLNLCNKLLMTGLLISEGRYSNRSMENGFALYYLFHNSIIYTWRNIIHGCYIFHI